MVIALNSVKCLILYIFFLSFIISSASANVGNIDDDIVANVKFSDSPGGDDAWVHEIDVSWTSTYSGYLYIIVYEDYADPAGQTVVNAMSGTPGDIVNLGLIDDTGYAGRQIRAWRLGYVHNGSAYSMGGSIYEPESDFCGAVGGAYQRTEGLSYSGAYTGHELSLTPGTTDLCSGQSPLTVLLIESSPPTYTLSGYVIDASNNPIQFATVTLSESSGEDVSNSTGFYEIAGMSSGNYGITATATSYERYSDYVSITEDTTRNITMTLDTGETIIPPIVAPPPIYTAIPTPTETPDDGDEDGDEDEEGLIEIIDDIIDNMIEELTELFDETIIEPSKVVIEEVITHVTTTFNWLLLVFVYLSTLAGRIVNKIEDAATLVIDTALYGTIALIVILLSSFIGLAFIFSNELIAAIVFVVVGFIFGILPEFIRNNEEMPGN